VGYLIFAWKVKCMTCRIWQPSLWPPNCCWLRAYICYMQVSILLRFRIWYANCHLLLHDERIALGLLTNNIGLDCISCVIRAPWCMVLMKYSSSIGADSITHGGGRLVPPLLQIAGHDCTVCRKTANQAVLTITKALTKTTLLYLWSQKSGGAR